MGVAPYFLATSMIVVSAGSTVTSYSEVQGMFPDFDLRGLALNRIPSDGPNAPEWPDSRFHLASLDSSQGDPRIRLASLDSDIITGSLPKPSVLDRGALNFPRVNRMAKQDRKQVRPSTSQYARTSIDTDELSGLTNLYFGQPSGPNIGAFNARPPRSAEEDRPGRPSQRSAAARQRDLTCLAQAIYFEARGESAKGQLAVAQVVMNRVAHWFYPNTVCDVVFQNKHRRNKCQFSFACDGRSDRARDRRSWQRAVSLARKVLEGKVTSAEVGTRATHYHASYVRPRWIRDMVRIRRIGTHIFYRVRAWS